MSCVYPGIKRDTLAQMGLASFLLHMGRLSLHSNGQCKVTEAYRMLRGSRTMPAAPKSQDSQVTPSLPTMEAQFPSHECWKGRGHMQVDTCPLCLQPRATSSPRREVAWPLPLLYCLTSDTALDGFSCYPSPNFAQSHLLPKPEWGNHDASLLSPPSPSPLPAQILYY